MNVHHLELFYHVATNRGISAASRKMPYGIQQPAISGQIAELEKTLGTKLFHRRPFALTPAGVKLHSEISHFFASLRDLPDQVRGYANQRLRLAAPARILRDHLPDILGAYKKRFANFKLSLFDANQGIAEELLRKGEIDLAITELAGTPAGSIKACPLIRIPLALVVPKDASFKGINDLFWHNTASQTLISLPSDEIIAKHFHDGLRKLGLAWTPGIELSSLELIETYVQLGFGVGTSIMLPRRRVQSGLRLLPLQKFAPVAVAALWIGELSEVAAAFLDDVREAAARLRR